MKLLGFFIGRHDSNVAAFDGQIRYAKSERINGIKHHRADLEFVAECCRRWNFKPDAIAFSGYFKRGKCAPDQLFKPTSPLWGVPTFCVDHHYAHVLSCWPEVPTTEVDVGISLDGGGDHKITSRVIRSPAKPELVFTTKDYNLGILLTAIGGLMGLGRKIKQITTAPKRLYTNYDSASRVDFAGKIMGLQAYGQPYPITVPRQILDLIDLAPPPYEPENQPFLDWVATAHQAAVNRVRELFAAYCTPADTISYSGGCALNTICNTQLVHTYPNLHIPPHCYDGGLALGCLEFLRLHYQLPLFPTTGFPFWQDDAYEVSRAQLHRCAELLARGKIVGFFQGRGEIGPRALGHRSILMDAAMPHGKDLLNHRVKHREYWRPFAPAVLEGREAPWFDMPCASPYMLYLGKVTGQLPAVTHKDGTSRVQTVREGIFAELLAAYEKLTGLPVLLNTSLNVSGKPIASDPRSCKAIPLDALCAGGTLIPLSDNC